MSNWVTYREFEPVDLDKVASLSIGCAPTNHMIFFKTSSSMHICSWAIEDEEEFQAVVIALEEELKIKRLNVKRIVDDERTEND